MTILVNEPKAQTVICDKTTLWVTLRDGRELGVPLAYFPRLLKATAKQRQKYILSGGGIGIHWDELDEDISVKHLLIGFHETSGLGVLQTNTSPA